MTVYQNNGDMFISIDLVGVLNVHTNTLNDECFTDRVMLALRNFACVAPVNGLIMMRVGDVLHICGGFLHIMMIFVDILKYLFMET